MTRHIVVSHGLLNLHHPKSWVRRDNKDSVTLPNTIRRSLSSGIKGWQSAMEQRLNNGTR